MMMWLFLTSLQGQVVTLVDLVLLLGHLPEKTRCRSIHWMVCIFSFILFHMFISIHMLWRFISKACYCMNNACSKQLLLIKFLKLPIHGTLIEVFINIILVWITVLKSLDTEQTDSPWEVSSLSWEIHDFSEFQVNWYMIIKVMLIVFSQIFKI